MLSTCALSTGVLKNPLQPSSSIVEALFWEQESKSGRGGREGVGAGEKRMKLGGFRQRRCKGEWMRAGAVQPATWTVLTQNNGSLSVALNLLVARWERAAVCPPLTTDTLSHARPLDNWILHPRKSSLFLVMSPTTRGPDRNSPRINFLSNGRVRGMYREGSNAMTWQIHLFLAYLAMR